MRSPPAARRRAPQVRPSAARRRSSIVRASGSRVASPSARSAAAVPAGVARQHARASSTAPARKPAGTSCTIPKSTKPSANSPPAPGSTSRFPGCGSAWKSSCSNTCAAYAREQCLDDGRRIDPGARESRAVRDANAREILGHEHARARELRHHRRDPHARRAGEVPRHAHARSRPRARSRARARGCPRAGRAGARSRARPRGPRSRAPRARRVERSAASAARTSGRCTLTATSRPSRKVARCTCASEAEAIGRRQTRANSSSGGGAQLLAQHLTHDGVGLRARAVLQAREPLDVGRGQHVGARRQELPRLQQHAAEIARRAVERRRGDAIPAPPRDADHAAQRPAVEEVQPLVAEVDARDRRAGARRSANALARAELELRHVSPASRHQSLGGSFGQLQDPFKPCFASVALSARSSSRRLLRRADVGRVAFGGACRPS